MLNGCRFVRIFYCSRLYNVPSITVTEVLVWLTMQAALGQSCFTLDLTAR
jgi:hypothetical protein